MGEGEGTHHGSLFDIQEKISIGATNYNRRLDFGHYPFKRAAVPISLFLGFIRLPMNGQSQKALNLSLFCEDFENREAEF